MDVHVGAYVDEHVLRDHSDRIGRVLDLVRLEKGDIVGDIGCGDGSLLNLIRGRVSSYYGFDSSPDFIRVCCSRHGSGGYFYLVDGSPSYVHFRGFFDIVFLLDVIEHVDPGCVSGFLTDVYRILKPFGRVVLHSPDAGFFLERLKKWGVVRNTPGHVNVMGADGIVNALSLAGFVVSRVVRLNHPIKWLSWFGSARLFVEGFKLP